MVTERWNKAQIAEKKFWQSTRKSWSIQNPTRYWRGILGHGFSLDYKFFEDKSVLEVGCGPTGIIFQLDNSRSRVGLEPLDLHDVVRDNPKRSIISRGMGEEIPFEDDSFDIVVSFNALDHSANPVRVVQEICRVLRRDGEFLLWIYVLRKQYRLLQGLLNKIDPPHPHHFTRDQLIAVLRENHFEEQYCKDEDGTGLPNNTFKKALANQMMNTLWLRSKKKIHLV